MASSSGKSIQVSDSSEKASDMPDIFTLMNNSISPLICYWFLEEHHPSVFMKYVDIDPLLANNKCIIKKTLIYFKKKHEIEISNKVNYVINIIKTLVMNYIKENDVWTIEMKSILHIYLNEEVDYDNIKPQIHPHLYTAISFPLKVCIFYYFLKYYLREDIEMLEEKILNTITLRKIYEVMYSSLNGKDAIENIFNSTIECIIK